KATSSAGEDAKSSSATVRPLTVSVNANRGAGVPRGNIREYRRATVPPHALGARRDRLTAQPARKIAFPDPNTLPAQNVVGRRGMKVEVRLREGQEEVLGGEVEAALPGCEAHVAADEGVDFRGLDHLERGARVRDPRLERRETLRRRGHIGREDASTHALDRTERVHRGR